MGNEITQLDFSIDTYKLLQLPHFCHPVEWAIKSPNSISQLILSNCPNYPIFVTQLNGQSNYPTQFPTWHLQITPMTQFLSPGWVCNEITQPNFPPEFSKLPKLTNFCHPVEGAIKLPNLICHLTSSNCLNYPIFAIQLSGQWNYPTQFSTWLLQIAKITNPVEWAIKLPNCICHLTYSNCPNYQFLPHGWLGNQITPPNLPPYIFKLPKFTTQLSGQSNYPTQFPNWHLQIAKITHPVEWAIKLPNPICHLNSANCQH